MRQVENSLMHDLAQSIHSFRFFFFLSSVDLYTPSVHLHQNLMHHHGQYQHENLSLSPQQSSTSDADETLTPPPSLNRMGVSEMKEVRDEICLFFVE